MRNFQTRATLLLAGILLVVAGPAWAQGTPGGQTEAYRSFPLIGSRLAVWGAAQLHLYFAAFILGVPMFAIIVEFIGWGGGGKGSPLRAPPRLGGTPTSPSGAPLWPPTPRSVSSGPAPTRNAPSTTGWGMWGTSWRSRPCSFSPLPATGWASGSSTSSRRWASL